MTNRPKGKLFALLAIFVAIGLVTATGAFTTVTAERTVDVTVAGDSAALLALSSDNAQYASEDAEGELQFDFDSPGSASGVNPNATTVIVNLFTATNQGSAQVDLTWTKSGSNTASVFLINSTNSNANSQTTPTTPITMGSGSSYKFGIVIDTTDTNGAQLGSSAGAFDVQLAFNATSTSA